MPDDLIKHRFGIRSSDVGSVLDSMTIHFQPISEIEDEPRILGFEALGRKLSFIGAQSIHPFLDEIHAMGLRPELELRTLEKACNFLIQCQQETASSREDDLYVTVNLHHETLAEPDLVDEIERAISKFPSVQSNIRFEILEETFPDDTVDTIHDNIERLFSAGYKLYLDDFGDNPGQDEERLAQVKPYIYGIKISGSFWAMDGDTQNKLMSHITHPDLSDKVLIIEGIETDEHMKHLASMRERFSPEIVLAQGWHPLLGASMPADKAIDRLKTDPSLARR